MICHRPFIPSPRLTARLSSGPWLIFLGSVGSVDKVRPPWNHVRGRQRLLLDHENQCWMS